MKPSTLAPTKTETGILDSSADERPSAGTGKPESGLDAPSRAIGGRAAVPSPRSGRGAALPFLESRADAADQRLHVVRLGVDLVCAQLQRQPPVGLPRARAQDEDRDPPEALVRLERPAYLVAVHARQHQVEHDQIANVLPRERQPLLAVAGLDDVEAVRLEPELEHGH